MTTIGNYDIVRPIAEGAFGATFLARHRTLDLPACAKIEKTGQEPFTTLFREEAKLLWDIRHVSLPTVKDYIESRDGQCILMSFVEGENLHDHVVAKGAIADEHCCWMLQRVLDALSYLHHHQVVHCDVKPVNCILDLERHNVTLVDFGLCTAQPTHTTRAKGGTKFFIPPEFELGRPPIPASDIYSLGMTAVAMTGGNIGTGTLPRDMQPDLRSLIASMVRHDPLSRPQDARELVIALSHLRQRVWGRTSTSEMIAYR